MKDDGSNMADEEFKTIELDEDVNATISQISTMLNAKQLLERSKNEGIPLNELVLVKEGGKAKAKTRSELQASDQIRRKQLIDKMKMRSIRGKNSLAEDVSRRLTQCQKWIDYISQFSTMSEKILLSVRRNLESSNNRASSLVKEFTVLENAIKRKKSEDPIIYRVEQASVEMREAIQNQDYQRANELKKFCVENMSLYQVRRNRLKPYLNQAREARMKFLLEKFQVIRMQCGIFYHVVELISKELSAGVFAYPDAGLMQQATDAIQSILELRTKSSLCVECIEQPCANSQQPAVDELEKKIDWCDEQVVQPIEEKINVLVQTIQQLKTPALTSEEKTGSPIKTNRMVFQQIKETSIL